MNEKFTPAPWRYDWESSWVISDAVGIICDTLSDGCDELEANGRLIAAAPEMYGMLQKILEAYEMDYDDTNAVLRLLAHARGDK